MEQMTGLDFKIKEMAGRIRELREITRFTAEEMAQKTGVSAEEYLKCENGESDLNFAFIYRCALAFGVDVTDIIEGVSPTLKSYIVTRSGKGQRVDKAHGMTYYNLAASFQNRIAEPLYVHSVYSEEAQHKDIELTTHAGQECDLVISGHLQVQVGSHKEILGPGDSIYYDSGTPHGMIAVDGEDCLFYAIVLNPTGEPIPELTRNKAIATAKVESKDTKERGAVNPYILRDSEGLKFRMKIEKKGFTNLDTCAKAIKIEIETPNPALAANEQLFHIGKLYATHTDYAAEMYFKSILRFPQTYWNAIGERFVQLGLAPTKEDMNRLITGVYTDEKDYHKRPLSKFLTDIAKDDGGSR